MRKARAASIAGLACLAGLAPATAAEGAPLGSRQLQQGMSGSDVRALQRALTRAGYATRQDGAFGRQTRVSVERFERRARRRVNGVVSRSDARALRRLALRSAKETFGGAVAGPAPKTGRATLMPGGLARPRSRRHPRSQRRSARPTQSPESPTATAAVTRAGRRAATTAQGRSASHCTVVACCEARSHRPG